MTDLPPENSETEPTPSSAWAQPVSRLSVNRAPDGAINLNIDGRQVLSPLQGFGQLWQKTYRVRLPGITLTAAEVMQRWKAEFPRFQPPDSHFYPSLEGIRPGSIMFIDLNLPVVPGLRNAIPLASGVMVLYADDEAFTVMTPQGFPVAGWNTFSVYEAEGCLIAQVQSIDRATDPIYELGSMLMGGARRQEENWIYVLRSLANHFGLDEPVQMEKELLDPRRQWSEARNIWYNAGVRTMLYKLAGPWRYLRSRRR